MSNKLDQLKTMTDVVADTGDIVAIERFKPLDATTNPSLILKAAQLEKYATLLATAKEIGKNTNGSSRQQLAVAGDHLAVAIGCEILKLVPGRVSTEVDSRLSFNTSATVEKARQLIDLYQQNGVSKDRVLIKIASTWEGIKAAEVLEKEGINCNLTLLFGFTQAVACADAGITLISPFVGRILDWYKADSGIENYPAAEDPGVVSVSNIYRYYKKNDYQTIVMGASFRNIGEIEQLAGCDRLTISPQLMAELEAEQGLLERKLSPDNTATTSPFETFDEKQFRWSMNENTMATEKLAQGIRAFTVDQIKLEQLLSA
ncbi:MAG: transaldolase [Pseudomonadales bacterium]|jgi:transaldolase